MRGVTCRFVCRYSVIVAGAAVMLVANAACLSKLALFVYVLRVRSLLSCFLFGTEGGILYYDKQRGLKGNRGF